MSGGGDRCSGRDGFRRALDQAYRRWGARLVVGCLVTSAIGAALAGAVVAGCAARYLGYANDDLALLIALGSASVFVFGTALMLRSRDVIRLLLAWDRESRTPELAARVWAAAAGFPGVLARRGSVAAVLALLSLTVSFLVVSGKSLMGVLMLFFVGAVSGVAGVILVVFSVELASQPLLRDVARSMQPTFEPGIAGWRLRAKALVPLPFIALYSALTVGAFADLAARGPARLAIALGVALATIVIASAVFLIVIRALLDPIDDLIEATDRVSGGDLSSPVPVVTGDELGKLASSFNQMIASLRRHEQQAASAEEERRRLERDIHDGAQQRLAAITMWLDGLDNLLSEGDRDGARAIARRASDELREAIEDLRRLARGTPPPVLALHGFDAAMRDLTDRTPGAALRGRAGPGIAPAVSVAAYFAVAEALANALRHSGAAAIEVVVERRNGHLAIDVRDDGCGGASLEAGSGLCGLAERLAAQSGSLRIDSPAGGGTALHIELPAGREEGDRP